MNKLIGRLLMMTAVGHALVGLVLFRGVVLAAIVLRAASDARKLGA